MYEAYEGVRNSKIVQQNERQIMQLGGIEPILEVDMLEKVLGRLGTSP
jgi:hypothetical protein